MLPSNKRSAGTKIDACYGTLVQRDKRVMVKVKLKLFELLAFSLDGI